MGDTRFGGSPRARSRSKSARRPLCANLIEMIVSRGGTFYCAARSPGASQPAACGCAAAPDSAKIPQRVGFGAGGNTSTRRDRARAERADNGLGLQAGSRGRRPYTPPGLPSTH